MVRSRRSLESQKNGDSMGVMGITFPENWGSFLQQIILKSGQFGQTGWWQLKYIF